MAKSKFECRRQDREKLHELVLSLRAKKKSYGEIASILQCSRERVRQILVYGPGKRNRCRSPTEEEMYQIAILFYNDGEELKTISERLSLSYSVCRGVVLALMPDEYKDLHEYKQHRDLQLIKGDSLG